MITKEAIEAAARAVCEAWHYSKIGTPDGDAEWARKQDQYRTQARAALTAAEDRGRIEERELVVAPAEEARKRFELWFFRDMNDEQRMKLFSLFGLPACGIKTLGAQQQVLRSVFSLIIGPNARDPFLIVADWHDKQARTFKDMSQDIRSGELVRAKANEASKHHAGSAAALRLHSLNSKRVAITKEPTP